MKHSKLKNKTNKHYIQKQKRKVEKRNKKLQKEKIKKQREECIVYQIYQTILHFFPHLFDQMRELKDCRKQKKYDLAVIITACLAMFIFKAGSRNEFNNLREDKKFEENYKILFKLPLPHMDTVNRVMEKIAQEELEKLKNKMLQCLLKKKYFTVLVSEESGFLFL